MKFSIPKCPTCGEFAQGTDERLTGLALLVFDDDGEANYAGETKIDWDNQTTIFEDGKARLWCHNGHTWLSAVGLVRRG